MRRIGRTREEKESAAKTAQVGFRDSRVEQRTKYSRGEKERKRVVVLLE